MIDFELKGLEGSSAHVKAVKLCKAVMRKIPKKDDVEMLRKNVVVILADKQTSFCLPIYFFQRSKDVADPIEVNLVVLSPRITDETKEVATYTIAHELAHAYLGHKQLVTFKRLVKK